MNKKNAISVIASKSTSCASLRGREKKLSVASFFAGVGGIELGFEQTGAFKTIYANEYDPYPIATYELNSRIHVDTRSICEVKPEDVPDTDIIAAGFPCTDLSIAGNRTGLRNEDGSLTRSGLFYELTRIIQAKAPRVVMLENVQHLEHHDDGKTLQAVLDELRKAGYQYVHYDVLSGDTHGDIPQNRERIFIVGFQFEEDFRRFSFPEPVLLKKSVFDVIDSKSVKDEKYYYREWKGNGKAYQIASAGMDDPNAVYQLRRSYLRKNMSGVCPTLTENMGKGGHNVPLILTDHGIRKLTPSECFALMGFPEDFALPAGMFDSRLYMQAGNSVIVPVVRRIAEKIAEAVILQPVFS